MTTTSTHPITVDGVRLDTLAYNITTRTGWDVSAGVRGSNQVVPGRTGELYVPGKRREAGKMVLSMVIMGTDADGVRPVDGNAYVQYRRNLDQLKLLFGKTHGLLDVQHSLGALGTRQAYCEVKKSLDPEMMGRNTGEMVVLLENPATYWQDVAELAIDTTNVSAGIKTWPALVGATAPIEDMRAVFRGPWVNPQITDTVTGHYIRLNSTLAVNEDWYIDCGLRVSRRGNLIGQNPLGGTNAAAVTQRVGVYSPGYYALTPEAATVRYTLGGSGTTANSRFIANARRKFL